MVHSDEIEQVLRQHLGRLRGCLQHASGESSGPEEGSDAWLLLNALVEGGTQQDQKLAVRFEQSGRWLAEQGGKLDARLTGLQGYIDALARELKAILQDQPIPLLAAAARLSQLNAVCVLALTRGYQSVTDQLTLAHTHIAHQMEHRLLALQRINGVSNSAMDLDQTLEVTAQIVA